MTKPIHIMYVALVIGWSDVEVVRKCAVSRAYYAAYHAVLLACRQLRLKAPAGHRQLLRFLSKRPDNRLARFLAPTTPFTTRCFWPARNFG